MDIMPNSLPDLEYQPDGIWCRVRDPHTGRRYKMPLAQAELLQSLDGKSWPGENAELNLSETELFCRLRLLYKSGLLQNTVRRPTLCHDDPGSLLLLFPCPAFLQSGRSLVPMLYHTLLLALWLPLLVVTVLVLARGGGWDCLPMLSDYSPLAPALSLALSVAIHELSHAAAACRLGMPVDGIGFGLYGFLPCGITVFSLLPFAGRDINLEITLAGPLSNIVSGLLALLLAIPTQSSTILYFSVTSLTLAGLNLLPLPGVDGSSLREFFPHPGLDFEHSPAHIALRGSAAALAALAAGLTLLLLPGGAAFLVVLAMTAAAAILLPSRYSVCWAGLLGTLCLLPVVLKLLNFQLLTAGLPADLASIGFCLVLCYLLDPVLLELVFATCYLFHTHHTERRLSHD